jgi:hypothetical protein
MIKQTKEYFDEMIQRIPALGGCVTVVDESHLGKMLRNKLEYPLLVTVVPSIVTDAADVDSVRPIATGLLFVLVPMRERANESSDYTSELQQTYDIIQDILQAMRDDMETCCIMAYFDPDKVRLEPEYNFLGHVGWSVTYNY